MADFEIIDGICVIPEGTTEIGDKAFCNSKELISVEIPDSVTRIGDGAFRGCTNLSSIEIPASATMIGDWAFAGCLGVERIKVSSDNPNFCSESNCLLSKDRTRLILGCKNSIIPDSVTEIGDGAFWKCTSLPSINIPDSVTKIWDEAFSDCTGLTGIKIPDSVTEIGGHVFKDCTGLTGIAIPNSVIKIGKCAFDGCTGLVSITIANSVTEIGCGAFSGCTSLTNIELPDSITVIEDFAFEGCTSLASVEIPNSVTVIGVSAFRGCASLSSITISNNVTKIEDFAFEGCASLTSIEIPDSVTEIGCLAFNGCTSLASIVIPSSVTKIGDSEFTSLVTHLGVFWNCPGVERIKVSSDNPYFCSESNCLLSKDRTLLFLGCKNSIIPDSVTVIGDYAFTGCVGLTSIEIPDRVSKIVYNAFLDCSGVERIKVSSDNPYFCSESNCLLSKDRTRLFLGCKNSIIPNSVTVIGDLAFEGCTSLTSIEIPYSVSKIASKAFWNCSGVERIKVSSDNPYFCSESNCLLSKDRTRLFLGCKNSIIPNSVTVIGDLAFEGCTSLTSIEIPDSVTKIGDSAFERCTGLASIEIPDSVTVIGAGAFACCTNLVSIEIPNSVIKIGNSAFGYCTSLASIAIANSVKEIGDSAFTGCSGLNIMVIGEQVPENCSLRKSRFYGVTLSQITLYVPVGTGYAYRQHPFFGQFKEIKEKRHIVNSAVQDIDSEYDDVEKKSESLNKQDSFIIPVNAQELFVDYDYKLSSQVDNYPFYYVPLIGTPIFPYRRRKILREGVSEQSFYHKLKKYIDCDELSVYNDVSLQVSNQYQYEPDIAVIANTGRNLRIDIEIDEPYSGYSRTPIHCIGYDDTRDQTLINLGWLVIRISEEQIVTSPLNCIKFISKIISDILPSFEVPESLLHDINDSKESFYLVSRWTKEEACVMAGDKYRELYLNRSGFGYVEDLSDTTETSGQTITESILSSNVSIETNITASKKAQIYTSSCEQNSTVSPEDEVRVTEFVKTHHQTIITLPKQRENRIEVISPYDSTIEEIMRPYFSSMSQDAYKEYDKDQHRLEQEILLYYGSNKRKFTESSAFGLIKEYIKTNNIVPCHAGMRVGHPSYHITGRIGFVVGDTLYDAKILRLGARGEDVGLGVAASLGDVPRSRYEIEETIKAEIVEQILNTSIKNMVILEVNLRTNRVSEVKLRRNKVARFILNDGKYDMSIRKI